LTLIDYGKNDLGVRGYLKCDIVMFHESHMINNIILSKPLGSTREDITFNKKFVKYMYISLDIFIIT